jgi:hypothetical protein
MATVHRIYAKASYRNPRLRTCVRISYYAIELSDVLKCARFLMMMLVTVVQERTDFL